MITSDIGIKIHIDWHPNSALNSVSCDRSRKRISAPFVLLIRSSVNVQHLGSFRAWFLFSLLSLKKKSEAYEITIVCPCPPLITSEPIFMKSIWRFAVQGDLDVVVLNP
jgi:hypothetical protein